MVRTLVRNKIHVDPDASGRGGRVINEATTTTNKMGSYLGIMPAFLTRRVIKGLLPSVVVGDRDGGEGAGGLFLKERGDVELSERVEQCRLGGGGIRYHSSCS